MSLSRIAVSLSDAAGHPLDVTAVILSDVLATYGIISVTDDDVAVPYGTELVREGTGEYAYEISLAAEKIYRYALKIILGTRVFYLRGYFCPAKQAAIDVGFSLSESDSESDPTPVARSVHVTREDSIRRFVFGQANSHRLRIRIAGSVGMTRYILLHEQRLIAAAGDHIEQFTDITSPRDIAVFPIGEPNTDQDPAYYRRDYIDVILPNDDVADKVWERMKREIDNLVATYNRTDRLTA